MQDKKEEEDKPKEVDISAVRRSKQKDEEAISIAKP